jgi:glucose-6-phosphate 1-dehydrogenase
VYYLATPPSTFRPILTALVGGRPHPSSDGSRIVVEKPLGEDAASARELDSQLGTLFEESQIYRIDHYLAKDPVQNILAFRFSNSLFELVWNRSMIDSIQITAAEELDVGRRAGYYDHFRAVLEPTRGSPAATGIGLASIRSLTHERRVAVLRAVQWTPSGAK